MLVRWNTTHHAATSGASAVGRQGATSGRGRPARIRSVTEQAGFTRFGQAAETSFNEVLEVRP